MRYEHELGEALVSVGKANDLRDADDSSTSERVDFQRESSWAVSGELI